MIPWVGRKAKEISVIMKRRRERMLRFVDSVIRHILWQSEQLEAFLESLGLKDVAPVVVQLFYSTASMINVGLMIGSAAMIMSKPKLATTLLLLFASL
jgi:hypothetical protein